MRHSIASFLLLLTLCVSSFAQERGFESLNIEIENTLVELYSQSHALLIGVSEYSDTWPDLPGVKKDIYAVRNALEQHNFNVVMVENPTKPEIDVVISNFIARYGQGKDNRLLFYFVGHGHTINTSYGGKLGYFVPSDAPNPHSDEASFQSKAIEMAQIEIYAKRIQSKHAIFIFDACFSGSLFATTRAIPEIISYKTSQPIRQFITSGTENEQVPDESIFRQQFVSALTSDVADGNSDGYLTGSELGDFLQTSVTNYSYNYQHPQFGKIRNPMLDKGDFVFLVPGNDPATQKTDSDTDDPVIGVAVTVPTHGSIELTTEIRGRLYLDGKEIGQVEAQTKIPINNISSGDHLIEIRGSEYWSRNITIYKDRLTRITASGNKRPFEKEISRSGGFTDTRYNVEYNWVKIGNQTWMAQNLNYPTEYGSWCPDDDESNCEKYGRLYNWETAIRACPDGWHLPSDDEWKELERYMGMSIEDTEKTSYRGKNEGGKLKTPGTEEWRSPNKGSNNESGFSAIPAGYRLINGQFNSLGDCAIFWSSTELGATHARSRELYYSRSDIYRDYSEKTSAFSVRCIKDNPYEY